jgi:hypothetical protein
VFPLGIAALKTTWTRLPPTVGLPFGLELGRATVTWFSGRFVGHDPAFSRLYVLLRRHFVERFRGCSSGSSPEVRLLFRVCFTRLRLCCPFPFVSAEIESLPSTTSLEGEVEVSSLNVTCFPDPPCLRPSLGGDQSLCKVVVPCLFSIR